jgi:hypothetical protein
MEDRAVSLALYSDRHGISVRTQRQEPSLEELHVEVILARPPQAKGSI